MASVMNKVGLPKVLLTGCCRDCGHFSRNKVNCKGCQASLCVGCVGNTAPASCVVCVDQAEHRAKYACRKCKVIQFGKMECTVCSDKFCPKCSNEAFGAQPEGPKCVDKCVGYPVSEKFVKKFSKVSPGDLGNHPERVSVNGQLLNSIQLQTLRLEKLKFVIKGDMKLFYDPRSGVLGEEGGPGLCMIGANRDLGEGSLAEDCSGGNTTVYFNGRELSAVELMHLMQTGTPIGNGRYWLNHDGDFGEEDKEEVLGNVHKAYNKSAIASFADTLSKRTSAKSNNQKN